MLNTLQSLWKKYPRQFWLLLFGMLISTIGSSMIWPFLMIYVSERLDLPLTAVASLMTLNSAVGILTSFAAGPVIDRVGRKWVMVLSLMSNGLGYLFMSRAASFGAFALLMSFQGAAQPLYRVGADAMMADLIPAEKRIEGYSLLRTSNNLGVATGPAIGGFVATRSYTIAFLCAACGLLFYSLLVLFFASETLPQKDIEKAKAPAERFGGYGRVLKDRPFLSFAAAFTLTQICAQVMWVLLSVHAKQNYGVSESQYGFIPTTNALMVVFLQLLVTRLTKRHPPMLTLAVGSFFYAAALTSVGWGRGFWSFLASMVVLTIGELILSPTSTTMAANLAPADMRGRYMSIFGLTWSFAHGIGPVFGGFMNDTFGPSAIWYGAGAVGMLSTLGFLALSYRYDHRTELAS